MYKLESDDFNNSQDILVGQQSPDKLQILLNRGNFDKWSYAVFHEMSDEKSALNTRIALSFADQWKIPAKKSLVDLLWFSLAVNTKLDPSVRIRNLHQAAILYELYEGHYKQVSLDPEKDKFSWTEITCQHPDIFPGYALKWRIPISFFAKDGKSQCTLSGLNYGEVEIFGEIRRIPRKIFVQWFKDKMVKGRIIGDDSEYVKSCFDRSNRDALRSCLEYLGLHASQDLKGVSIPMGHSFIQERKLIYVGGLVPNESHLWEQIGQTWVLLPRAEYIPLLVNADHDRTDLLIQ